MHPKEPPPVWPEAPRYRPDKAFPPYRFTPGVNPHPRRDPQGHAFGRPEKKPAYMPPEQWRKNALYLHGVDLYHQGYLWESHEAWESLWHLTGKEDVEGQFLQGLIQNSAALLKIRQGLWDGARHLSREAHRRLTFVMEAGDSRFMGIDVRALVHALESYYGPLWEGRDEVSGRPSRLTLE